MTLSHLLEDHPRAPYVTGTHYYRVPRGGTNYRRGEDWHCRVTVRHVQNPDEAGLLGIADGTCVYRSQRSSRFWFDGRYA
jgi:hypothetical protein